LKGERKRKQLVSSSETDNECLLNELTIGTRLLRIRCQTSSQTTVKFTSVRGES
jgi:hypothetical protein